MLTKPKLSDVVDKSRRLYSSRYLGSHMVGGFQTFMKGKLMWVAWQRALVKPYHTPARVFAKLEYNEWVQAPVAWDKVPNSWGTLHRDWLREAKRLAMEALLLKEEI